MLCCVSVIEEYDQFHDTHDWKDYVFDVYNLADIISYFMIAMAIALRILGASVTVSASAETKIQMLNLLQFGYAFSLPLLCLRSITVLKVGQSAGVLIIMLGKMQAEIVNWVKVVVVFTIGFSFFFAVMMPGALQGYEPFWPSLQPFWYAHGLTLDARILTEVAHSFTLLACGRVAGDSWERLNCTTSRPTYLLVQEVSLELLWCPSSCGYTSSSQRSSS